MAETKEVVEARVITKEVDLKSIMVSSDMNQKRVILLKDKNGIYGFLVNDEILLSRPDKVKEFLKLTKENKCTGYGQLLCEARWGMTTMFRGMPKNNLRSLITLAAMFRVPEISSRIKSHKKFSYKKQKQLTAMTMNMAESRARRDINFCLKKILDVADPEYLRISRRFSVDYAYPLYKMMCLYGERFAQLCETFPLLAIAITDQLGHIGELAIQEMMIGKKLNYISEVMSLPIELKTLPPKSIGPMLGYDHMIALDEKFLRLLGSKKWNVKEAKLWISVTRHVNLRRGPDRDPYDDLFEISRNEGYSINRRMNAAKFISANMSAIMKEYPIQEDRHRCVNDILDWIVAIGYDICPNMSLRTAIAKCDEWHEATMRIRYDKLNDLKFDSPWIEEDTFKVGNHEWQFVPLDSTLKLVNEGRKNGNCVASYANKVYCGDTYIYSGRCDGKRRITIELKNKLEPIIVQARTKLNQKLESKDKASLNKWASRNKIKNAVR